MRTVTNYFIVNLSLADVLVTAICLPASLLVDITESWLFGHALCKVIPYLQVSSPMALSSLYHICPKPRPWWLSVTLKLVFQSSHGGLRLLWGHSDHQAGHSETQTQPHIYT